MSVSAAPIHHPHAGVVFIDHWHALVAQSEGARPIVTDLTRELESEPQFLLRVAREIDDCDRLVVMGPGDSRLAFERDYVALYQRPDRLLDDEVAPSARAADLLDRLRILAS